VGGREVGLQLVAGVEHAVAEVHRQGQVDLGEPGLAHVGLGQLDAAGDLGAGGLEVVLAAVREGRAVEVDAEGGALRVGLAPLGRHQGGAAEVLAQAHRLAAAVAW
jgi:hypothetical protein